MTSSSDSAKDLLTLAGGPSILGVTALLGYLRGVLSDSRRIPRKGWTSLGAGLVLLAWLSVFLVWASPTVWQSWFAQGDPKIHLFLLSATWVLAGGLVMLAVRKGRDVLTYISESYHSTDDFLALRMVRRVVAG